MFRLTPFLALVLLAPFAFAAADREAARSEIMIPVAGTVDGANGTRFQTDVTLADRADGARVDVYWLPQGRTGSATPVLRLQLQPNSDQFFPDFVRTSLGQTGLGTIIFRAVKEDGSADPFARIDAYARIWTRMPNGSGTMSQGVPATTLHSPKVDDFQPIRGNLYGLRQDALFRTNIGIINLSQRELTFTVHILFAGGSRTVSYTLPPRSMIQSPLPAGNFGPVSVQIAPEQVTPPRLDLGPWTGYGSSIDNLTGDAWYSKIQTSYLHQEG
jgi:hypothetical protein